ncbi:MAG TPA: glycerophosphodiester phosphodiesterase family protein [Pseudolabrys sp.]|nr:glycerophosphodiester phosphodiesterase family protein [Pseudolabrys sp.]
MAKLDWLTARPIAHRGLHGFGPDPAAGAIENTATAFSAAIAGGYAIETDIQISADGEAMVHHDDALGRLTEGEGRLANMTASAIQAVRFKSGGDRILRLTELCELVAGRAPLVIEIKSRFDGDLRLARRAAEVLTKYKGPAAVMSFDPAPIETARHFAPTLPRGIVAERHYAGHEWDALPGSAKFKLAFLLHAPRTRPNFIAYSVKDLPAVVPLIARNLFGLRLLTWTVRNEAEREIAARYADQIIFESWRPNSSFKKS